MILINFEQIIDFLRNRLLVAQYFPILITRGLTPTSPLLARHAILLHTEGTRDKALQVFYFPQGFLGQSPSLEKYVLIHQGPVETLGSKVSLHLFMGIIAYCA